MNDNIEKVFNEFNLRLRSSYENLDKRYIRERLETMGEFYRPVRLSDDELASIFESSVAAVDGSINSFGGAEPNVTSLIKACYLPNLNDERIEELRLMSPLTGDAAVPNTELARLEALVAVEGLNRYKSKALFMDGGFIRFIADAGETFNTLLETAARYNTLIIGVIEDMESKTVAESLELNAYDREIFFGLLDKGEAFILDGEYNNKYESGINTVYFRPGAAPNAISVDYPVNLKGRIHSAIDLLYTLTPEMSRGIPLILDLVDRYTRVTAREMESYMKAYIDEDLRRIYLDEARKKRWL